MPDPFAQIGEVLTMPTALIHNLIFAISPRF